MGPLKDLVEAAWEKSMDTLKKQIMYDMPYLMPLDKVPCCDKNKCEYCVEAAVTERGAKHLWCHHPMVAQKRASQRRWIKAKERGKTSPEWCPLRAMQSILAAGKKIAAKAEKEG